MCERISTSDLYFSYMRILLPILSCVHIHNIINKKVQQTHSLKEHVYTIIIIIIIQLDSLSFLKIKFTETVTNVLNKRDIFVMYVPWCCCCFWCAFLLHVYMWARAREKKKLWHHTQCDCVLLRRRACASDCNNKYFFYMVWFWIRKKNQTE